MLFRSVAEGVFILPERLVTPTLVRGILPLAGSSRAVLLDVSGRRAAELLPGTNDVSHLSPGIYFVVSEPLAASRQPSAVTVRKVVVQR